MVPPVARSAVMVPAERAQVAELTVFSKPKEYDQATQLLRDLHVIARREDDITAFTARVRELRTRHAKRPSLMDRLDKAGLPRLE
jgi:hypothetical protein